MAAGRPVKRKSGTSLATADGPKETSRNTISDWLSYCREICFVDLDERIMPKQGHKLGGPGVTVEVDEAKIGRRKNHKGRLVEGHWILGLIEIQTGADGERRRGGRFRLEILPENDKSETTLVRLIQKHVLPGTTVVTDGWKGYTNLADYDFDHYTVIHEYNFVDPTTGANTQTIESNWRPLKLILMRGGIKESTLHLHLAEYLWRREILIAGDDPFKRFLNAAAYVYNPVRATAVFRG